MRGTSSLAAAIVLALAGTPAAFAQVQPTQPSPQTEPVDPFAPPAQSPPLFDYAIGFGVGRTDNLTRSATDTVSQNILEPSFNFTFNQQGSTLQTQVVGLLQYTDYLGGYLGNEFRGQLTGQMNWVISPQRLNFVLQDYSSVEPVNTRYGNAPSNQQQVNVFATGPTLAFKLGGDSGWQGQADLRYINTTASKTKDFNSERGMGALRLVRDLSLTNHLSLNLEGIDVRFNDANPLAAATRYDQYNAYARYQSNLARTDLDFALGGSRVDFSQNQPGHSGLLARASISWRADARNTLQASGVDQLADATANLVQPPDLGSAQLTSPTVLVGRTVISPAVFRERNISVGYGYRGDRFNFTLSPYYGQLRQLNGGDLSQNGYGVVAGMSYLLTPLTTLGVTVGDQTTEYISDNSRDRDHTATINLSKELTPHWSWSVAFRHDQRHSTRPGFGYTENEVFAFLYYRR
ncbi:MAG: hypothetical protein OJF61_002781 [Rhodanobacteraceae bacterium]|jgi:hypothetical protein|nr:MAG: hypothetical protein OJF61_002781 [Rhodanobacteraceae bacterium]